MRAPPLRLRLLACALVACGIDAASAADYRSIAEQDAVLYDAPATRAKALFLLSRDTPVEVIVALEGWTKVRDASGTIGWVDKKTLGDRRTLIVRAPVADVRATAEDNAPVVFRAEQNVLLELAEPATSAGTTAMPGWVGVKHRDGQAGYVRITQVFGL